MPKELTDIDISFISLVKSGANGKEVIYKSAAAAGEYSHTIEIKKTDGEQGTLYGIVYAPDQIDSQGDFASAGEIKKAAYRFMKSAHTNNVDVDHSFKPEDAFVAESWITKGGDTIFADEPEGSWAVAIQLESDDLRSLAKSGEIAALSMGGEATRVAKAEPKSDTKAFKKFFEMLADVVSGVGIDMYTYVEKGEKLDKYKEEIAKKVTEATAGVAAQLEGITKATDEQSTQIAQLTEDNKKLTEENKKLSDDITALQEKITALEGDTKEVKEEMKKSSQRKVVKKSDDGADDTEGVL